MFLFLLCYCCCCFPTRNYAFQKAPLKQDFNWTAVGQESNVGAVWFLIEAVRLFIKGFLIFPCFVAAFWSSQRGELAKIRVCKIFWYLQSLTWNETVKFNWWRRFPKISKTKAGKSVQETDIGHKHKHKSDSFWVDFCYSDCSYMNYFQTSS